ncbi:hypothetical protein NE237_001989 [Protea cynaroides]|uniref:Uncharacterized protein n=1 Tax=Protea cynaroides TaxID=273540 RepID=A0A9Q0KU51_9MAGN|nr:hypothetical protein NE237_001989 [Protea cynaroides]
MAADFGVGDARSVLSDDIPMAILPVDSSGDVAVLTIQSTVGISKVIRTPCFQVEFSERCLQTIDGGLAIGHREIGLGNSLSLEATVVMADGSLTSTAGFGSCSRGSNRREDIAMIGKVPYMVTTMGNNLGTPCMETMAPTRSQSFFETDYGSRDCCNRGARWWLTTSAYLHAMSSHVGIKIARMVVVFGPEVYLLQQGICRQILVFSNGLREGAQEILPWMGQAISATILN